MIRLLFSLSLLFITSACQQSAPLENEIRIGLAQMPMSLDPRYATDAASHRVQELMHRGLVRLDEHFRPQPDAAKSWTHPDALTWNFLLRSGLKFHDGTPVQAGDVAATLNSVLNAANASPLRAGFTAIRKVEVVSGRELIIHLSQPDASLLTRLSIGIIPARLAARGHQPRNMIGCGPCHLLTWDQHGLVLAQTGGDKKGRHLRFVLVKDPVTRCLKLARGEIDFAENDLPPHLLPYLRRQKQLSIASRASTTFSYIGLNLHDPILKDVRVRHALALSLDRMRLKNALFSGLPELAETVLVPSHWAAAQLPATPYDPQAAERLLDQAGYPRKADGIRFALNYRTSTDPSRLRLATAIASMWHNIGVEVHIESLEWGGFYARIKRGDFQVYSLSWVGVVDPDIYRWILHSDMWPPKGANRGRYSNHDVDQWLDAAARTENRQERRRLYGQIERQMAADQVYIPLWYEPVIAVSGPRISGFTPALDGSLLGLLKVKIHGDAQ
ncbi:MAG: ABC transporter substrate-binding protein [Mariprofundaceae bacterium]|nr:ABC transporter substrate-binding protein [Mariprofundaceae bacterium]